MAHVAHIETRGVTPAHVMWPKLLQKTSGSVRLGIDSSRCRPKKARILIQHAVASMISDGATVVIVEDHPSILEAETGSPFKV